MFYACRVTRWIKRSVVKDAKKIKREPQNENLFATFDCAHTLTILLYMLQRDSKNRHLKVITHQKHSKYKELEALRIRDKPVNFLVAINTDGTFSLAKTRFIQVSFAKASINLKSVVL